MYHIYEANPRKDKLHLLKVKLPITLSIILFFILFQHLFWKGDKPNTVCNNDKIMYSEIFMEYHQWVLDNWSVRTWQCIIINLWITCAVPILVLMFIILGPGLEA